MKKLIKYFKESRQELKKVVWPSREAVISSTKVVIVSTVLVAIFLGLVDFLLLKGVLFIL
ncbi:MAG: preprotein translocase subunit SecE [Sphaerochaeta sp.]|jgi:preprotein translocase subunit SecE|nr:preprotein translocase subunit SecE [Spirochaetales bacterium]